MVLSERASRSFVIGFVLGVLGFALALAVSAHVSAQTGGTVTLEAVDAQTGQTVQRIGDAKNQAIRLVTAQNDPLLAVVRQLLAGPNLRDALGQPLTSSGGALNVNVQNVTDPCQGFKQSTAISQTATTRLLIGTGQRYVLCGIFAVGSDAENLSLVEGTGTTCGTGTTAIIGGTAANTGPNFAANGGWVEGFQNAMLAPEAVIGDDICLQQSGSGRVAGHLSYALWNK